MNARKLILNKETVLYGCSLALLLFVLKWVEFRFYIVDHAMEVYIGFIALIFTGLGLWLSSKLLKPKAQTVIVEKTITVPAKAFERDERKIEALGISKRELEVLELMARGFSNQEIADKLFLSLSTIKTHSSSLLVKLDARRRTQAVENAKRLNIIQ